MIRRHDFNSEWWGEDVGIVTDSVFFDLAPCARSSWLRKFAWVEFAQPVSQLPSRRVLAEAGFFYADTQAGFRLDLRNIPLSQCARELSVQSAAESRFEISPNDMRSFVHERFCALPGATQARISSRYSMWASRLVQEYPITSLRLTLDGATQGWFLAQSGDPGLQLTLAMLNARAGISGYDLYSRAIAHFGELGHRLGHASFSVRNSNVLNIYSRLGARFLEPREYWMWVSDSRQEICEGGHGTM